MVPHTPLPTAIIWHQHQPQYRDLSQRDPRGALRSPWVRLHALRDYYGMAALLAKYPAVHLTFNFSPTLLEQLDGYARGATDTALELTLMPAERLGSAHRRELSERFFDADWHHQIYPHRRYTQLLRQRMEGDLSTTRDLRDLQMWYNLAWFGTEMRSSPLLLATGETIDIARFAEQGQDFAQIDIEEMVHEQFKLLRAIIPLHAALQASGQIEISTSPYAHPILPLLIDTDGATLDRPGATYPARFHYPADADAQVSLAIAEYVDHFGDRPRGMWPSEGAVSPDVISLAVRHQLRWIATDEGVLQRSGRWGYESNRPTIRSRGYRAQHDGDECAVLFRDRELSDLLSFDYQYRSAPEAVLDLITRLRARATDLQDAGGDTLITIVLDGENAWGAYPDDGRPFLHALYTALTDACDLVTVTPSEYLEGDAVRALPRHSLEQLRVVHDLATASWIDEPGSQPGADLGTWIGEPEENRAWAYLALVRDDMKAVLRSVSLDSPIRRALYAAEGSDWFWWFGDDQESGNDAFFESLFLMHLRSVYSLAGLPSPAWLPARLSTPQRVWAFTRPIAQMGVGEELFIVTPCPGLIRWRLSDDSGGEPTVTEVSGSTRNTGSFLVRLGPFRSDARLFSFSFHCRHPDCDGRGPCCDEREWHIALAPPSGSA